MTGNVPIDSCSVRLQAPVAIILVIPVCPGDSDGAQHQSTSKNTTQCDSAQPFAIRHDDLQGAKFAVKPCPFGICKE
jgi:hypothetical protein